MPDGSDRAGTARRPPPFDARDALFLDFDGTLVELAATPEAVRVPPSLPGLLQALSARLGGAVALVSGRRLVDLAAAVAPFAGAMAGQHGGEIRAADGGLAAAPADPALDRARDRVLPFAAAHPGLTVEDKGGTLALHYRQAPLLGGACRALGREVERAAEGRLRAIDGHGVVELVPRGIGKGAVIARFADEPPFRGRRPFFVGDDTTDEDGFAAVDARGGISVKVGPGVSAAQHRLADVDEVWGWLSASLR